MPASTQPSLAVKLGGNAIKLTDLFEVTVDSDLDQPDMAAVVLSNIQGSHSSKIVLGDPLEVEAGGKPIFKGEVTGIEPIYVGRERSPAQIARTAVAEAADAVELCLGAGGVLIIRELLRELDRIGRRDISLVLHRMA